MTETPASLPPASLPLVSLDAVVLDTETTGLDPLSARIVQIGALRLVSGAIQGDATLEQLVNPGVPIPAATTAIHGLADQHVKDAPGFAGVVDALEQFIGLPAQPAIVIGHTIGYDLTVFATEAKRHGRLWRQPPSLDVRIWRSWLCHRPPTTIWIGSPPHSASKW